MQFTIELKLEILEKFVLSISMSKKFEFRVTKIGKIILQIIMDYSYSFSFIISKPSFEIGCKDIGVALGEWTEWSKCSKIDSDQIRTRKW